MGTRWFSRSIGASARLCGLTVLAAAAIPIGPALAQTVQVGSDTVTVPSDGQIVIDGQEVQVSPDATRVFLATPPPQSTEVSDDGQTDYQLPPGASGASFSYSEAEQNPDAVTLPTSADYGAPPSTATNASVARRHRVRARAAGVDAPTCYITPYPPGPNGGRQQARGTSAMQCNGFDATEVQVRVQSTLYWSPNTGNYEPHGWGWQGYARSPWDTFATSVTFTHACTKNTTSWWKTRADGSSVWRGQQISYEDESHYVLVPCS